MVTMPAEKTEELLLSDLCAICHSHPAKYKCPRCSIKTCSLPCIKRHKLLSECTGVRDPAAYRKRNDLATPASFDQDFNFITGLERSLERADRDAANRGINFDGTRQRLVKGEHRLHVEQDRGEVTVRKAPAGMSRSKQNKTHWNQRHKRISWTVEWILQDGQKIFANCLESTTISQAFANAVPKKFQQSRKRKLDETCQNPGSDTTAISDEHRTVTRENTAAVQKGHSGTAAGLYFYLHRPDIASRQRCVSHIASDTLLCKCLQGRTVHEFPTLYILNESPENVAEHFELVDDQKVSTDPSSNGILEPESVVMPEPTVLPETTTELGIDDQRILDALKQDLGT